MSRAIAPNDPERLQDRIRSRHEPDRSFSSGSPVGSTAHLRIERFVGRWNGRLPNAEGGYKAPRAVNARANCKSTPCEPAYHRSLKIADSAPRPAAVTLAYRRRPRSIARPPKSSTRPLAAEEGSISGAWLTQLPLLSRMSPAGQVGGVAIALPARIAAMSPNANVFNTAHPRET